MKITESYLRKIIKEEFQKEGLFDSFTKNNWELWLESYKKSLSKANQSLPGAGNIISKMSLDQINTLGTKYYQMSVKRQLSQDLINLIDDNIKFAASSAIRVVGEKPSEEELEVLYTRKGLAEAVSNIPDYFTVKNGVLDVMQRGSITTKL